MKTMMKKSASIGSISLLALALLVVLGTVSADEGNGEGPKPAPLLVGTSEYYYMGHLGIFDPEGRKLGWQGTVDGDIQGEISWWMVVPSKRVGQTNHFVSRWEICDSAGVVLLAGYDAGVTTVRHGKNSVWEANGTVTDASPEYEGWIGRYIHEAGHFSWTDSGRPDHGYGTFQIN